MDFFFVLNSYLGVSILMGGGDSIGLEFYFQQYDSNHLLQLMFKTS